MSGAKEGRRRRARDPLPQDQRVVSFVPQYNPCVLVGNWVEERRCYVQTPFCHRSVYSTDYTPPPPAPSQRNRVWDYIFRNEGLPYDLLFWHGPRPPPCCKPRARPPRRGPGEAETEAALRCEAMSGVTETRARYLPPPGCSYVCCRAAVPRIFSSSFEPINKYHADLYLRGKPIRVVPECFIKRC